MTINLSNVIHETIKHNTESPRNYIGASIIGHPCLRKIWYQFKGIKADVAPSLQITFDIGKILEHLLMSYIALGYNNNILPCTLSRPVPGNDFLDVECIDLPIFKGHLDGILTGDTWSAVLEIKTAKDSSFNAFKKKGLKIWNPQYYAQIQAYMGMANVPKAVLIALNKDDSSLHEEWIDFDPIYYQELVAKAQYIARQEEAPERLNKSPLYITCKMCQYKELCHG